MKLTTLSNTDLGIYTKLLQVAIESDTNVLTHQQEVLAKVCNVCPLTFRKSRQRLVEKNFIKLVYTQNKYKRLTCSIEFMELEDMSKELKVFASLLKNILTKK